MTQAGSGNVREPLIAMTGVHVWTPDGKVILRDVAWTVHQGEQWALLGPNGSGKSTLLSLAAAVRHPSTGSVSVLGGTFGQVDMPALRRRISVVDPAHRLLDWLTVEEVVLTGATATIRPVPDRYGPVERDRAAEVLALVGCPDLAARPIKTCSQGERQRIRIARALMPAPALLLLDEPAVGLDLPAREALIAALTDLAAAQPELAMVVVTHHLEELPSVIDHAILLREGAIVAQGDVVEALTSETVSRSFGLPVVVGRSDGRWTARGGAGWAPRSG